MLSLFPGFDDLSFLTRLSTVLLIILTCFSVRFAYLIDNLISKIFLSQKNRMVRWVYDRNAAVLISTDMHQPKPQEMVFRQDMHPDRSSQSVAFRRND